MIRSPLGLTLAIALAWLAIALLGLVAPRSLRFVARVLFPLGAALGAALAGVALGAIAAPPHVYVAPLGLPDLPFHFRLDALSAFFLLLLGAVSAGVSVFAAGYMRPGEGTPPGLLCLWYHLFLASMALRAARRRRLRLHGRVGDDGAVVVLPRDEQPPPAPRSAARATSTC